MSRIIKRICKHRKVNPFLFFLITGNILLFQSCNTRIEGCLDINAKNFDLDAEKACDDCCEYPPIFLSLSPKWNDQNFATQDTLFDINGDSFKIVDLKYILSSISWNGTEGTVYSIDSAEIDCGTNTILYTPDILLINPAKVDYVIDSIRLFPSISSFKMKLGWFPPLECVDETSEDIPFLFSDESAVWDSVRAARAAIRIILQRDINMAVFDTVFVHTCQEIFLPYNLAFQPGMDTRLKASVNHAQWFMDARVDDLSSFETSVESNIEGSFTPIP